MGENTKIEWADHTFNAWIGCSEVGPGCDNCYARAYANRIGQPELWEGERRRTKTWNDPVRWNRQHEAFFAEHGRRQRVFLNSLSDWLDNEVPAEWLADLLLVIMETPNLDWLLLTKRIGNFRKRLEAAKESVLLHHRENYSLLTWIDQWLAGNPPSNVVLMITVVNQDEADRDIIKLLRTPARIRGLSMEPLLGPVGLARWIHRTAGYDFQDPVYMCLKCGASGWGGYFTHSIADTGDYDSGCDCGAGDDKLTEVGNIDWVIVGGEDGPRPMNPDWVRSLRDECADAFVAFMFKQWGAWAQVSPLAGLDAPGRPWHTFGKEIDMWKIGKVKAGRNLDGRMWDQFPEALCQSP